MTKGNEINIFIGIMLIVIVYLIQRISFLEGEIKHLSLSQTGLIEFPLLPHGRQLRNRLNDTISQASSHHRNIFIDLGSNNGESLLTFMGLKEIGNIAGNGARGGFYGIGMDGTWNLFAVEPIPRHSESLNQSRELVMSKCKNVRSYTILANTAMSNRDGTVELIFDTPKGEYTSFGTSIFNQTRHGNAPGVMVKVMDIVTFLKTVVRAKRSDNVIIKMDIENAEYDVLRRLFTSGLITLVDRLFIEFHQFFPNAKNYEDKANKGTSYELPKQCLKWMLEDAHDVKWEEWGR